LAAAWFVKDGNGKAHIKVGQVDDVGATAKGAEGRSATLDLSGCRGNGEEHERREKEKRDSSLRSE